MSISYGKLRIDLMRLLRPKEIHFNALAEARNGKVNRPRNPCNLGLVPVNIRHGDNEPYVDYKQY